MAASHDQLPSDMIFEVLARTCLQTLDSSKLVCKEWNSLGYDSKFLELHSTNTNTVSGYLVQSMVSCKHKTEFVLFDGKSSNLSLGFLPTDKIKIEASSTQGLFVYVCSKNHWHDRYYVCKPSTKQVVALPNPKMRYMTENVALVVLGSNPLRYKIIRLSIPNRKLIGYSNLRCEIFDSATWAWKELVDIMLPHGEMLMPYCQAIYVSGSLHYLTNKDRVLAFDEKSECYHFFELPRPAFGNDGYMCKKLLKYKGSLGFTCKVPDDGCFELWVLNNYGNYQYLWKKEFVLTTQVLKENGAPCHFLAAFANPDVALLGSYDQVMFYNVKNCDMNVVQLNHVVQEIFAFRSDHETVVLKGRD